MILFEVLPQISDKEHDDDRNTKYRLPGWMAEQLSQASPDLLRAMLQVFAEALMSADADAVCGAGCGQRSPDRTNTRNGYRLRGWDTRAGSIDLAIPRLREGSYFPGWLLERRRRAESALVSVVATSYLLGVWTRRMEKLVETLGVTSSNLDLDTHYVNPQPYFCGKSRPTSLLILRTSDVLTRFRYSAALKKRRTN